MKQRIHTWIIGYDNMQEKIAQYKDESTASANCSFWQKIEAETIREAKEIFKEIYTVKTEE